MSGAFTGTLTEYGYLELLVEAERALPLLLQGAWRWKSMLVTYEHPHVERIYSDIDVGAGPMRVMLHKVLEVPEGATPLWHPHPWPSAVRVLEAGRGRVYEMDIGRGPSNDFAAVMRSSGELRYAMVDPAAWHYVRPIGGPSYSVMVVGPPFQEPQHAQHRPKTQQGPLSPDAFQRSLMMWREAYTLPSRG